MLTTIVHAYLIYLRLVGTLLALGAAFLTLVAAVWLPSQASEHGWYWTAAAVAASVLVILPAGLAIACGLLMLVTSGPEPEEPEER